MSEYSRNELGWEECGKCGKNYLPSRVGTECPYCRENLAKGHVSCTMLPGLETMEIFRKGELIGRVTAEEGEPRIIFFHPTVTNPIQYLDFWDTEIIWDCYNQMEEIRLKELQKRLDEIQATCILER